MGTEGLQWSSGGVLAVQSEGRSDLRQVVCPNCAWGGQWENTLLNLMPRWQLTIIIIIIIMTMRNDGLCCGSSVGLDMRERIGHLFTFFWLLLYRDIIRRFVLLLQIQMWYFRRSLVVEVLMVSVVLIKAFPVALPFSLGNFGRDCVQVTQGCQLFSRIISMHDCVTES